MLQVRGTNPLNTKAVQVDLDAESLNSNDVFVIFSKKAIYIWSGKVSLLSGYVYALSTLIGQNYVFWSMHPSVCLSTLQYKLNIQEVCPFTKEKNADIFVFSSIT